MIKKQTSRILMLLPLIAAGIFMSSCSQQLAMVHSPNQHLAIVQATNGHGVPVVSKPETVAMTATPLEMASPEVKTVVPQEKAESPVKMNFIQKKMAKMAITKIGNKSSSIANVISKSSATEHGAYYEHSLRVAIVLIIIGLVLEAFGWPLGYIGFIFLLIGLIFLLFWLLDMA